MPLSETKTLEAALKHNCVAQTKEWTSVSLESLSVSDAFEEPPSFPRASLRARELVSVPLSFSARHKHAALYSEVFFHLFMFM